MVGAGVLWPRSSLLCAQTPLGLGLLNPMGSKLRLVLALSHGQRRWDFRGCAHRCVHRGVCADTRLPSEHGRGLLPRSIGLSFPRGFCGMKGGKGRERKDISL